MTRHPDTYGEVGLGGEAILPLAHLRERFGASNTDGIQVAKTSRSIRGDKQA